MPHSKAYLVSALGIDLLLLLFCVYHVPTVLEKPRVPFDVSREPHGIVVQRVVAAEASDGLQSGDVILKWSETPVEIAEALEFLADLSSIGDRVVLTYRRDTDVRRATIELVPYYDSPIRNVIIILFVGVIIWGVGVFVLVSRPEDRLARTLHWAMMWFATGVMITWGKISPDLIETYISRILFFVSYSGVISWLLYFTLLFPRPKQLPALVLRAAAFLPAGILFLPLTYFHHSAIHDVSVTSYASFQSVFDIFHVLVLVNGALGIVAVAHSLRHAETENERRRIRWVVWGLSLGPLPFLGLIVLPQLFGPAGLIPEEYTTIFLLLIPLTMALSVVRYRTFDIEIALNRGLVYAVLSFLIATTYIVTVMLTTSLIGGSVVFEEYLFIVIVTLLVAAAFNPLRNRIQKVVDEAIFSARVNFRNILRSLSDRLRAALSPDEVFRNLVDGLSLQIEASFITAFVNTRGTFRMTASWGDSPAKEFFLPNSLLTGLRSAKALARNDAVAGRRNDESLEYEEWLGRIGADLVLPLRTEAKEVLGIVLVGSPSSGQRFDEDEFELLVEVCSIASEVLERLILQEHIFLENEEKRRLEELGQLKTFFVSSVSHELRMPLTSIRMFAETLRRHQTIGKKKQREYLEIIEGESERLARLIENVLDFSKIERGVKEYNFADTETGDVVQKAVKAMRYQFENAHAKLRVSTSRRLPRLHADADAIEEAIINLLSNALKYSTTTKDVSLKVRSDGSHLLLEVKDKGVGIPESEHGKIFEAFYRVRDGQLAQVGGAGLGLALVKHIVEAHSGTISFTSTVGKGTTFVISLPVKK